MFVVCRKSAAGLQITVCADLLQTPLLSMQQVCAKSEFETLLQTPCKLVQKVCASLH